MYVPLHVGVFFLLVFFLKVAFACIDGMCSNFILQVFSFCFHTKREFSWGGGGEEEFQFVLLSPHHVNMFSSGTLKILLVYWKN